MRLHYLRRHTALQSSTSYKVLNFNSARGFVDVPRYFHHLQAVASHVSFCHNLTVRGRVPPLPPHPS